MKWENNLFPLTKEEFLSDSSDGKFIFCRDGDKEVLILFSFKIMHVQVATLCTSKGHSFVGGGYYFGHGLVVNWDTESCRDSFGYDRPADENQANEILNKVQAFMQKLANKEA